MCTSFSNPLRRIARALPFLLAAMAAHAEKLELQDGDVIAVMGGTTMVQVMESGYLESLLTHHHPSLNLRFRDFSNQDNLSQCSNLLLKIVTKLSSGRNIWLVLNLN